MLSLYGSLLPVVVSFVELKLKLWPNTKVALKQGLRFSHIISANVFTSCFSSGSTDHSQPLTESTVVSILVGRNEEAVATTDTITLILNNTNHTCICYTRTKKKVNT